MKTIIFALLLIQSSLLFADNIVVKKNELTLFLNEGSGEYINCTTIEEDVVIGIKKSGNGFKLAFQRNNLAINYYCIYESLQQKKDFFVAIGQYDKKMTYFKIDKNYLKIYINDYMLAVKLNNYEKKKLIEYLI